MKQHYKTIDKAFLTLNEELEKQAIAATIKLSKAKKNKDSDCGFVCAMGSWFWWTDEGSDILPPANKSWQKAFDEYGYLFMRRSIKVICRNGRIIYKTREW